MRNFIVVVLINAVALFLIGNIVSGITISGWQTLIAAAIILTLINVFLKPIISFITIPINIMSLGFFTLIINGILFYFVGKIVKGFVVVDFWSAFIGALLLSVISILIETLILKDRNRILRRYGSIDAKDYRTGKVVIDVDAVDENNKKD